MIHDGYDHDIEGDDISPEASEVLASPPTTGGKGPGTPAPASNENGHHNGNGVGADLADEAQLDAEHDEYARQALAEQEDGDATNGNRHHNGTGIDSDLADIDAMLDVSVPLGNGHQQANGSHPQEAAVEGSEAHEEGSTGQTAPLPYSERPISLYESPVNARRHLNRCHTTMTELHAMVVTGAWKDDVEALRENVAHKRELGEDGQKTPAARAYDKAKLALTPFFTAGGSFLEGQREKAALATSSGIRMMDVDSLTAEETIALREEAKRVSYCVAAWVSSSGLGVHLYLAQDPAPDASNDHASWEVLAAALERDMGVKIEAQDASVKDISRACFGSYDPDAYLNPQAVPLAWTPPAPEEEEEGAEGTEPAVPAQRVKPLTVADNTGDAEGMSKSDWSLHAADCENRPGFKADWEKIFAFDRPDLENQSVPAYETQLATLLISAGWGEPEETGGAWDIGPTHRAMLELRKAARQADKPVKDKQPHYFQVVIEKAIQDLMSRRAAGNGKKRGKKGKTNGRIQDAAARERVWMDLQDALEFLAEEKVGEDDSLLLAVGKCLKAMGHDFTQFDAWAARAGCTCTDRANRWKSFKARDRDYSAIVGMAVKRGLETGLRDWYQFGEWLGGKLKREFRYDSRRQEWWVWDGSKWVYEKGAIPRTLAQTVKKRRGEFHEWLAELSGTVEDKEGNRVRLLWFTEENLNKHLPRGITSGLQVALNRPFPDYQKDRKARTLRRQQIATPTGVVDLVTGKMEPHDPLRHDTRSVTTGCYRPGWEEEARELLRDRLLIVFDDEQFENFLTYLGMTVSGQGQSFRGIVLCKGGSGAGKGGVNSLLVDSWGDRAYALPMKTLENSTQEIDATRYYLMVYQPLFIIVDEGGNINVRTLNSMTGNTPLPAARLPWMDKPYQDTIPGVIWWASVDTPKLTRGTGIDRRMAFLSFPEDEIPDEKKDASAAHKQDLIDAVVTVGIQMAMKWLKRELKDPRVPLPADVKADMDPIQEALDTLDTEIWAGKGVTEAMEAVIEITKDKTITPTSFGNAVNVNRLWMKKRATSGPLRFKWVMQVRPGKS